MDLGVDLVLANRRHLGQGIEVVRLILGHFHRHDYPVIRGDLWRHLQGQRRFAESHRGSAATAGFLIGHFGALEDPRSLLVGSDHFGLGDDFAIAGFLHGTELKVEQDVIAYQAQANGRGGPLRPQIDKGVGAAQNQAVAEVQFPAPAHAQAALVIDIRLDDPRLDHDLTYRHIQASDQLAQLLQPLRGLASDQGVGPLIDTQCSLGWLQWVVVHERLENRCDVCRLGIVNRQQLTPSRRQTRHLLTVLKPLPFLPGQFARRRHQQDIALATFLQPLATQHQIQRLFPGHLLQTQGDPALHRITGDKIDAGKIGQYL
ncbi:hypothetical protein D3C77_274420 [compost metagenome]